jgi:hypothetical protein
VHYKIPATTKQTEAKQGQLFQLDVLLCELAEHGCIVLKYLITFMILRKRGFPGKNKRIKTSPLFFSEKTEYGCNILMCLRYFRVLKNTDLSIRCFLTSKFQKAC